MHKVRIVQKLQFAPIERRLQAMNEAGNNTFLLHNDDVFMDMLTDSGVNAMSDQQLAAMMVADDSYAGSATYTRLENKLKDIFAMEFVEHIPQEQYPAGALAAALYIVSGVRGMERGTMSEQRDPDGGEVLANMELVRLAMPRRVFTLSQVKYAIDRIEWLYANRHLIAGLEFTEKPEILRFFYGRLAAVSDWQEKLVAQFRKDFGDSL